jgi:hypothetical protein
MTHAGKLLALATLLASSSVALAERGENSPDSPQRGNGGGSGGDSFEDRAARGMMNHINDRQNDAHNEMGGGNGVGPKGPGGTLGHV